MSTLRGVVPAIIDTHIHQWDPFTTPRTASPLAPIFTRAPRLLTALMPVLTSRGDREMIRTPENVARPYLPPHYSADVAGVPDAVGVAGDEQMYPWRWAVSWEARETVATVYAWWEIRPWP